MFLKGTIRRFSIFLFCAFPFLSISQNESDFNSIDEILNINLFETIKNDSNKVVFQPRFSYLNFATKNTSLNPGENDIYCIGFNSKYLFNNNLILSSNILHLNGSFPSRLSSYIDSTNVYPGSATILSRGYEYTFRLGYKISKHFKLDFGRSKHFIGSGYRSLLLSNESSPYNFFRFSTNFGKINYYNLYTSFVGSQDFTNYKKKYSTIHYLEYSFTKHLSLGIFESIVWSSGDSLNPRGYDIEYLNPIIFYRPIEFSKGSPDNALMGLNLNYNYRDLILYGQVLIDDLNIARRKNLSGFMHQKIAFQLGSRYTLQYFNHNLIFLTEYNQAQPYTYSHRRPFRKYTHYNQALAHPLGANFKELIFITQYEINNWSFLFKLNYAVYGADTLSSHWGQNIFDVDYNASREGAEASYGNYNGQGVQTDLQNIYTEIAYKFKEANNLEAHIGCSFRKKKSEILNEENLYFFAGLRTFFYNPFQDY